MCAYIVCCRVLQSVAECCRVLQSVAVCCSALVVLKVWRNMLFVKHTALYASSKAKKHSKKHIFPKNFLVAPVRIRTRSTRSSYVGFVMGWPRVVGMLKLWVSFAEYSLFYTALLQKKLVILRSLLIVATP